MNLLNDLIVPTEIDNTDLFGNDNDQSFATKDYFYYPSQHDKLGYVNANDFALFNLNINDENFNMAEHAGQYPACRCYSRSGFKNNLNVGRVCIWNEKNEIYYIDPSERNISHGSVLCTNINLKALLVIKEAIRQRGIKTPMFRIDSFVHSNGYLILGEMPQYFVGKEINQMFENLLNENQITLTGKTYTGCFDKKNDRPSFHNEYEYKGKRYVRMKRGPRNEGFWFEVAPLSWEIVNWENLPSSINPTGKGEDKILRLRSANVLHAGIPFYPKSNDENNYLWQNSAPRGFFNGINVNNIQKNGNLLYTAPNGGDFTRHNFIEQAFDGVTDLIRTIELTEKKSRIAWGVKIAEKPLSINEQIEKYIKNGHTVMLHGPSGIGKSRRVQEIDPDYVSLVLRNGMLPEEIMGKNIFIDDKDTQSGQWTPPAWYDELCRKCAKEPNKQHVLFIDEITNVREQEQSAVFHIILEKSIGSSYGKLPDNVSVVAAGNNLLESLSAYEMPEPLERRFIGHVYIEPNIPEWLEWACQESKNPAKKGRLNIHPLVANFVASAGVETFCPQYDRENPPKYKVDPRGWEQVSDLIYDNDNVLYPELICNKIGPMLTEALKAFAKTPMLSVQDIILENYESMDIPHRFDACYAMTMMWRNAKMDEVSAVRNFIKNKFNREILAAFDTAWANTPEKAIFLANLKKQENDTTKEM